VAKAYLINIFIRQLKLTAMEGHQKYFQIIQTRDKS